MRSHADIENVVARLTGTGSTRTSNNSGPATTTTPSSQNRVNNLCGLYICSKSFDCTKSLICASKSHERACSASLYRFLAAVAIRVLL